MMKRSKILPGIIIFFLSVVYSISQAQEYTLSQKDYDYVAYRSKITTPPYGLPKVKRLIAEAKARYENYDDGAILGISSKDFKSLSLREKFTYTIIYPEMYMQNCDVYIPKLDEYKNIFSHLKEWKNEALWSDRQLTFLREYRDSVMHIIKESTTRSKHMGANYKEAILEINGWEMIPFITDYFKSNKKDKEALTLLLLLMQKGEYVPFLESTSYKKLYGQENNYETYINYNLENEKLIIDRANGYFKEKSM